MPRSQIFSADRNPRLRARAANTDRLCERGRELGLVAKPRHSAEEALTGADLVVTSVTLDYSIEPFLDARWLKPGAFAAITDLCIPWIPETMDSFGTVVIDDREQEDASESKMVRPDLVRPI